MAINYESLLDQAKQGGKIPAEALNAIRSQLEMERFEADPYTLIHILGKLDDRQSLSIIKRYLTYDSGEQENDALVRRIALQVLGRMWALPEIFETAIKYAFGDPNSYVRAAAATIVGFLGSRHSELRSKAASALIRGLEQAGEVDEYTRESFYFGLLELFDVPANEWPSPKSTVKSVGFRKDLIEKAKVIAVKDGQ